MQTKQEVDPCQIYNLASLLGTHTNKTSKNSPEMLTTQKWETLVVENKHYKRLFRRVTTEFSNSNNLCMISVCGIMWSWYMQFSFSLCLSGFHPPIPEAERRKGNHPHRSPSCDTRRQKAGPGGRPTALPWVKA